MSGHSVEALRNPGLKRLIRRNAPTDSCHNLTALSDATLHENIVYNHSTLHVLTEIQTTCIMLLLKGTLWSGNGG